MKYLGLVLVLLSWVGSGYILAKWRGNKAMSLSAHAATSRHSALLFAGVLIGVGSLFYVWMLKWFVPALGLSRLFIGLLTLAFAAQLVAGLVPSVPVVRRQVHRMAAYGMALVFLPLSFMMLSAPNIQTFGRVAGIVCLVWLSFSCLLFALAPKARKAYLIFQVLYVMVFQLQILLIAYSGSYS